MKKSKSTSKPKKQNIPVWEKHWKSAALVVLLLLVGGVLFFRVSTFNHTPVKKAKPIKPYVFVPSPSPTPEQLPFVEKPEQSFEGEVSKDFKQVDYFKPWFNEEPYPNEMTTIQDTQIVAMQCSPKYTTWWDANGEYTAEEGENSNQLSKQFKEWLIQDLANGRAVNKADAFWFCETDSLSLAGYETNAGGGGGGNKFYLEKTSESGNFMPLATINNSAYGGTAYFGCATPYFLTKSNELYIACGGGDGGFSASMIYKINLETGSTQLLKYCKSVLGEESCK